MELNCTEFLILFRLKHAQSLHSTKMTQILVVLENQVTPIEIDEKVLMTYVNANKTTSVGFYKYSTIKPNELELSVKIGKFYK